MTLKFLQLNIFKGKYLNVLLNFLKKEKFDILNLQEVAGGELSLAGKDCFAEIKSTLNLKGIFSFDVNKIGDPTTYFANAIFFQKQFSVIKQEVIRLNQKKINFSSMENIPWFNNISRHLIYLTLKTNNHVISIVNTHLTRGDDSQDDLQKLTEGQILVDCIKNIKEPYVLSGDFNVNPRSNIIKEISKISRNLLVENNIKNTLNFRTHPGRKIIPPPGIACDYIFAEKSLQIKKFKLIDHPALSDHFGLAVEIEI